jgi:outer membrane protein TolC
MRFILVALLSVVSSGNVFSGDLKADSPLVLRDLVDEALKNNPEIKASLRQVDAARARVGEAGALADPQLTYMREQMPGFRWSEANMQKIELMQMVRFPTKLSTENRIAGIDVDHFHHELAEKELDVVARVRSAFYDLWFAQQANALNGENARLLQQFVTLAKTKFGVGEAALQDVLRANVELAKLDNQSTDFRQREQSAIASLVALLNRRQGDSLRTAFLPDSVASIPSLDSLQELAMVGRPLLIHDSLAVQESDAMLVLSKQEYIPDLTFGVQYVTMPAGDFRGWSVSAGISLPFAPWTLNKAGSRVDEASARISKSREELSADRNSILASIADLYAKVQSLRQQYNAYRTVILPQANMSLKASLTAYQTGGKDFLTLIDSYRTLVELSMESLMVRKQFEEGMAQLERVVGVRDMSMEM